MKREIFHSMIFIGLMAGYAFVAIPAKGQPVVSETEVYMDEFAEKGESSVPSESKPAEVNIDLKHHRLALVPAFVLLGLLAVSAKSRKIKNVAILLGTSPQESLNLHDKKEKT